MKIMPISNELWERNYDLALKSLKSRFVTGLRNGDLPIKNFQDYIAQDYFFLESFARAYGLAISKCPKTNLFETLSKLLLGVSEELVLHKAYVKKWNINLADHHINSATKKYTDFLLITAKNQNYIETLSAMAPCMRLYAWLGKKLSNNATNNPYKEWILTYSDVNFENLAKSLENLIDNSESDSLEINLLNHFYKKAMELELEFFEEYSKF